MNTLYLPALYHQGSKGAIVQWQVWTVNDEIHTLYGQVDGKQQQAMKKAVGKNTGKANATTAEEQAQLEAKAMWTKRLEGKYSETIEEAKETVFLPMLAHKFADYKKNLVYPVDVQPKLDGLRCLVFWRKNRVCFLSRGGKDYTSLDHLGKKIACWLPKDFILDGELYLHGLTLQEINRRVKKYRPGKTEEIQYWCYDGFPLSDHDTLPWQLRFASLRGLWSSIEAEERDQCRLVRTTTVDNEADVLTLQQEYMQTGFEGAIVRARTGPNVFYTLGHRNQGLLKVKSFDDTEFPVIGFKEGVGRFEKAVVWTCKLPSGETFDCVPKGTMEQKREWFANGHKYIGKLLTVKHQGTSETGVPLFPVGLGFRLEEDLP